MFTALDAPPHELDARETRFVSQIREHGWFRTNVLADEEGPGFSYTTGFWSRLRVPEIIVFSLTSKIAHDVLRDLYRDMAASMSFPVGQRISTVFANSQAVLFPVSRHFYPDYLGWGRWFYGGDDWPCVQLIWPDANGVFPWEADFDRSFAGDQPNLTGTAWPSI